MPRTTTERADELVEDAELVRLARAGSCTALGELYERFADTVYDVALRLLASPPDAEDVLHDIFVGLPNALQRYEERGRFSAWLRRLAGRRALMLLRARGRRAAGLDGQARQTEGPGQDPVRRIAARDAIAALPDSLRAVFVLKEVEGYSHAEIGSLLGISARASALRLHRAWKTLRRREAIP